MARQSQRAKRTVHQSQRANQNGPSESKSRAKNDPSASALLQLWQRRQQLLRVAAAGGADPHAARRPGGEARNGRLQAHMRNNSPASSGVGGLLRGAKACTLPAGRAALGVAPRRRRAEWRAGGRHRCAGRRHRRDARPGQPRRRQRHAAGALDEALEASARWGARCRGAAATLRASLRRRPARRRGVARRHEAVWRRRAVVHGVARWRWRRAPWRARGACVCRGA
mmetsp:Transcript_33178/g.98796  ORF Transcript_33178/g.98796 Transcript_33178/m.98796 type:complete len:226 (-) Transcript_33178:141-818(-)